MSTTTTTTTKSPHILVFPFPSSGHFIPSLDLSHQLLNHGFKITVLVTTPTNLSLLQPLLSLYPLSLHSLLLSPPPLDLHLHHDQSIPLPPEKRLIAMIRSLSELSTPILDWFGSHPSPPSAIISDFFLGWTRSLASQIGIQRLCFSPSGALAFSISNSLWRTLPNNNKERNDDFLVSIPNVPDSPIYPWWQLSHLHRTYQKGDPDWEFFRNGMLENTPSWGIVFNSFTELERVYIDHMKKEAGHDRVWAVGPLLPSSDDADDASERGGSSSVPAQDILTWLDQRPDRSVVYVCFGSRASLTLKQVEALAAGLECSEVHFVWCIRTDDHGELMMILEGYEDRVADRGFVIKGWAPQVAILRHKAVGAFVTHCGWNSVLEGISAGVVMLTWPMGADQFSNATLLVDQLGVGIRVGEGTRNIPESDELARILNESVEACSAEKVEELRDAALCAEKVKELRDAALCAVKGGSSERGLDDLVKRLSEL